MSMTTRLIVLGTAAAIPDAAHENTYMVLDGPDGAVLIDCAGSPIGRLEMAGVDHTRLRAVVITHLHPDHSYGLPMLLMGLWLLGRSQPLTIYAPDSVASRLRAIMDAFEWSDWPHFFSVEFRAIPDAPNALVIETADFRITASRNQHMVLTISLRIENRRTGRVIVYSSDTAPCAAVVDLARGCDLLIHEAAGATVGHSSAAQAGEMATQAGAQQLVLVHYQVRDDPAQLAAQARSTFAGPIEVAQDLAEYPA